MITLEIDDVVGSVYLYQGTELTIDDLGDNGGSELQLPYASAVVSYDGEFYHYEIGFVASADYSIAFSCDIEDSPEIDDSIIFEEKRDITVISGDLAVNFPAEEE